MKNRRTRNFRRRYTRLPDDIKRQANASYKVFKIDPYYPGLHFECINKQENLWSTRVGAHYRAVGAWIGDTIWWDFIGTHEEYNHLL